MTEKLFKIPGDGKVIDEDWKDDVPDFETYQNENKYDFNNVILIDPNKVKNATAEEAKRKIGKVALFSISDKLVA